MILKGRALLAGRRAGQPSSGIREAAGERRKAALQRPSDALRAVELGLARSGQEPVNMLSSRDSFQNSHLAVLEVERVERNRERVHTSGLV